MSSPTVRGPSPSSSRIRSRVGSPRTRKNRAAAATLVGARVAGYISGKQDIIAAWRPGSSGRPATHRPWMIGRTLSDAKGKMQIRIEASDFPGISCGPSPDSPEGYRNIHVGVQRRQRRDELLGLVSGDATSAAWSMDCIAVQSTSGVDLKGPYIQVPPGGRYI